jgi:formiminoglutamase
VTDDPNWPRADGWLRGDHDPSAVARLAVVGAPVRLGSLSGGRFDQAPDALRSALSRYTTFDAGSQTDVRSVAARDQGDLDLKESTPERALDHIAGAVGGSLPSFDAVVLLGGDNSITRPGVRGLGLDLGRIGVLTIDAHHDLRDTANGLNNGNPVRALLEEGLPGTNIVQVGIQPFANSKAYAEVAREVGITVVTADEARQRGLASVVDAALDQLAGTVDAIYVDLDVDVLDRAFAPGCPGSRPGGLTPAEVQAAARVAGTHPKVRAIDIVEVDPTKDVADVTVLAAASFLLSFAAGLVSRSGGG